MKNLIATLSFTTVLCGMTSIAVAQTTPTTNSATSLQGLQERSVNAPSNGTTTASATTPQGSALEIEDPTEVGVVIRQFDDRSQLVLSPARDNLQRWDNVRSGLTGDNKIQFVYGLEQPR